MDIKLHRLESFPAQDIRGAYYTVYGYERLARAYPWLDTAAQWESTGVIEYKLASGEHLDVDEDGTLLGAVTGVRLHRPPH
ncbi:MAG: hypothetical protein EOP38_10395 [Rubrivivax sp.]|nr:MAG: hypothetical protein EOP38_10395 [Rubrivivax sp.]